MGFSYYGPLCTEVYEIDKPIGYSFGDIEFYLERLKSCSGAILEIGSGSGRVLIPLLEAGLEIDGLEESESMLTACKSHCKNRNLTPRLYQSKMQDFNLNKRYEAIIIPCGSFLLLADRKESIKALECFYNHLLPDGQLILDLCLQNDFEINKISTRSFVTNNNDIITMESKLVEVDFINQFTVGYSKYEKWRQGKLIATELQRFPLRWYGVEEFLLILKDIGFNNIVVSGDYKYNSLPIDVSKMITFEGRR